MDAATNSSAICDRMLSPLADCFVAESARRLLEMKADPQLQGHVDALAARHMEGRLGAEERSEYGRYVANATFIAILKSKVRRRLAAATPTREACIGNLEPFTFPSAAKWCRIAA